MLETAEDRVDEFVEIYFSFKIMPFKFLHSLEKKSSVEDKRFARSNKVSKVNVLFARMIRDLVVEKKPVSFSCKEEFSERLIPDAFFCRLADGTIFVVFLF